VSFIAAGLSDPTIGTVARTPGSVRRTSHIDMVFDGPIIGGRLELLGHARDLLTPRSGPAEVLGAAQVRAALDETRVLRTLETHPSEEAAQGLVGRHVGVGFRAEVERLLNASAARRSPLYLLLDDLPVAALISGYAGLYTSGEDGPDIAAAMLPSESDQRARMIKGDICAGWRSDGTMMVALRTSKRMPAPVGPPAPSLARPDDPLAWHEIAPLASPAMRRRRLVDVTWGNPLIVAAMFRDTHKSTDGVETVLHEYTVSVTVDPRTLRVLTCEATPRSLPWTECPEATGSARRLEGQPVSDLRRFVRKELTGTTTCTHLNDLLRSLADVAVLAPVLQERGEHRLGD